MAWLRRGPLRHRLPENLDRPTPEINGVALVERRREPRDLLGGECAVQARRQIHPEETLTLKIADAIHGPIEQSTHERTLSRQQVPGRERNSILRDAHARQPHRLALHRVESF